MINKTGDNDDDRQVCKPEGLLGSVVQRQKQTGALGYLQSF